MYTGRENEAIAGVKGCQYFPALLLLTTPGQTQHSQMFSVDPLDPFSSSQDFLPPICGIALARRQSGASTGRIPYLEEGIRHPQVAQLLSCVAGYMELCTGLRTG